MSSYYSLRIYAADETFELINQLLGVKTHTNSFWELQFTQNENDKYYNYFDYFLSVLDGKYDQLEMIGVNRDDISFWLLYEYDGQCNLEFNPTDMQRMGKEGITLCISCWEGNNDTEEW